MLGCDEAAVKHADLDDFPGQFSKPCSTAFPTSTSELQNQLIEGTCKPAYRRIFL